MKTLIRNCRYALITDPELRFVENTSLLIENGKLSQLSARNPAPSEVDEEIDGSQLLALPGMTNGHTHVAMAFFKGLQYDNRERIIYDLMFKAEKHLTHEIVYALTRLGLWECLMSGNTQVVDHYYFADAVAQACVDMGMRGIICDCALDLQGPKTSAEDFQRTFDFIEKWRQRDPLVHPAVGPHAPDSLSEKRLKELVDYANKHSMILHFHLAQTMEEVDKIYERFKCTPTQYAFHHGMLGPRSLAAHSIYVNDTDLRLLKETQTTVAYCPTSQVVFATLAPIRKFEDFGLNVILGTDCVGSADHMSLLREAVAALSFEKYMHPAQTVNPLLPLEWCTNRPDAFLDRALSRTAGTRPADLILCDLSHHEHLLIPDHDPDTLLPLQIDQFPPKHIMINGRWVVRDYKLTTANADDIKRQGHEVIQWMKKKTGMR